MNSRKALQFDSWSALRPGQSRGFSFTDLLVVIAISLLLAALVLPVLARNNAKSKQVLCISNLKDVNRAVQLYAEEHRGVVPYQPSAVRKQFWWFYKELVKGYVGLKGPSSPKDSKFACPNDRGYTDNKPFRLSERFDYGSYVLNAVDLPGMPNIANRQMSSIKSPKTTLLTMEFPAHGPYSWHSIRTGNRKLPFFSDAESVVGFVDGHVNFIKIYYDGINPAFTRDPIPGYEYKYSGD
jgi:type II secretory pathway pseudopilin PulG